MSYYEPPITCTGNSSQSFSPCTGELHKITQVEEPIICMFILNQFYYAPGFPAVFLFLVPSVFPLAPFCPSVFRFVPFLLLPLCLKVVQSMMPDNQSRAHCLFLFFILQRTSPTPSTTPPLDDFKKMIFVVRFAVTCYFLSTASTVAVSETVY